MQLTISKFGSIIALLMLSLATYAKANFSNNIGHKASIERDIEALPMQMGEWNGIDAENLGLRSLKTLNLDRYVRRKYKNTAEQSVFLYIGFWKDQTGDHQAAKHSPTMCLPANGWIVNDTNKRLLNLGNETLYFNTLVGQRQNHQVLFNYWFISGEHSYSEEWLALLSIAGERFLTGRTDGAIIEASILLPQTNSNSDIEVNKAQLILDDFLATLYPRLKIVHVANH